MAEKQRPLSPHLQIYRKQVQMMTSITHRATGIALAVGGLLVVCGLLQLAAGEDSFNRFKGIIGSPVGMVLLFGWSWALFYHLCNGIRHLIQDAGLGYEIPQFVRSSWLSVAGSIVLTAATWAWVMMAGGAA
ncbi:MAG: succinate dehydrogenase, cytochrome b556 subunit [Rhodanobacter sp.]|jgi:succinate dehydrogenase / fumarate reductase cytochrome b subunit|uniref:Succinate dehydrogenase cytochrome b556 subunit n=2 Tax=unclassified Rhodanobacter TaxID=2621553 RepID=A0AB74UVB5_9GAMM|nr:succinate dehydrogenase, cytochrome b556 subunit [Rhodanobacter sp.]MBN8945578.1 succinate dehydrogenase, cytochrome b556 subunit [Rhodanobacter sp.]ODT96546.1 MAG: succinate dehydrogenase, cytochrome b556 subunit [Rhodanobacter sp. SCN 67-45]OJW43382.1 MAG: succinate dehydrogenase, cytochrome b556 subunit [Rhodanobacter sp. 67-28]